MKTMTRAVLAALLAPVARYAERHLICFLDSTGGGGDASTGGGSDQQQQQGSTGDASQSSTGGSQSSSASSTGSAAGSFKWGDGWREQVAAGDAKVLQRLGRFNSPEDMWRSYTALEGRMSSGEMKPALKADATDIEKAEWRKANGIPDKPEGYDLKFDNGFVIGAEDKPTVDKFLAVAHANNMVPAQVKEAVAWYFAEQAAQTDARALQDTKIAQESQDALRNKWSTEFRPNMNAFHGLLDAAPAGLKEQLLHGRLADGTPIGSSVQAIEWIAGMARELNPASTVVPGAGANVGQAITGELDKLTAMMGNRNSEYWRSRTPAEKEKSDALQARYRELVDAQNKMAARK